MHFIEARHGERVKKGWISVTGVGNGGSWDKEILEKSYSIADYIIPILLRINWRKRNFCYQLDLKRQSTTFPFRIQKDYGHLPLKTLPLPPISPLQPIVMGLRATISCHGFRPLASTNSSPQRRIDGWGLNSPRSRATSIAIHLFTSIAGMDPPLSRSYSRHLGSANSRSSSWRQWSDCQCLAVGNRYRMDRWRRVHLTYVNIVI